MTAMWSMLGDLARELTRWWLEELRAIIALAFPRIALADRRPVLVRRDGRWFLAAPGGRTVQELEPGRQPPMTCDLAIPLGACLVRRLSLPGASQGKLQAMARLDIERATPLKSADVYSGIRIEAYDHDTRRLRIGQYVAKRERIAGLLEQASESRFSIGSPVVFPGDDPTEPPIELNMESGPSKLSRASLVVWSLMGLVLCLSISALLLRASDQARVLDQLDAAIDKQRALAKPVLEAVERSKAEVTKSGAIARQVAAYRPVVVVLDDLTGLLPDDVWANSLRFSEGRIELSGYAPSAANLVKLIEASPAFASPSLTSPIMYDRNQGKEQFTLSFELRAGVGTSRRGP